MYGFVKHCTNLFAGAPLVQIDQDKYPSTSGNTVTLVCDVYSSLTVSEVYWQRAVGGQFTKIDVSGTPEKYGGVTVSSPSLVVKSVTTGDAGEYRCVAVNIAGTGQDTTILEVQGSKCCQGYLVVRFMSRLSNGNIFMVQGYCKKYVKVIY